MRRLYVRGCSEGPAGGGGAEASGSQCGIRQSASRATMQQPRCIQTQEDSRSRHSSSASLPRLKLWAHPPAAECR